MDFARELVRLTSRLIEIDGWWRPWFTGRKHLGKIWTTPKLLKWDKRTGSVSVYWYKTLWIWIWIKNIFGALFRSGLWFGKVEINTHPVVYCYVKYCYGGNVVTFGDRPSTIRQCTYIMCITEIIVCSQKPLAPKTNEKFWVFSHFENQQNPQNVCMLIET